MLLTLTLSDMCRGFGWMAELNLPSANGESVEGGGGVASGVRDSTHGRSRGEVRGMWQFGQLGMEGEVVRGGGGRVP